LFAAALLLLGAALLDPVLPLSETRVESRGLDIVLALDLSSSMQEPMERPSEPRPGRQATRLDATKDAIKAFVARRVDDRIGLVVFSDNAYVVSPLTFDHPYLTRYVDMVDDQMLRGEGMTAIGEGLALSNFLLTREAAGRGRRNKVVVLFTDGENNAGREPLDALAESDAAHIRVHMIGVDFEDEVKKKPPVLEMVEAVRGYGGRYFSADTTRELDEASRTIDRLEKGVLVSLAYQHDTPMFQWFAVPALACLAAAFALRALPLFIDQT
jgi:Ca-activated chloride channel family protein